MFVRIWLFRPKSGCEDEFEAVYGEDGAWLYESLDRRAELITDMEQLVEESDAPP